MALKFLFYSPISWPHLAKPIAGFPHSNEEFDPALCYSLYATALELFELAEDSGFDILGVGEEHMNAYGVMPNPCLFAAALSIRCRHSQIAVLGNPIPLLNPLRVAEEYAMLSILTQGRFIAGFPRGVPQNYSAYNVDTEASHDKLREGVGLIMAAWKNVGRFPWEGRYYSFPSVSIWPRPLAIPDSVFSGKSQTSVLLAIEHRGIIAELYVRGMQSIEHFGKSIELYKDLARCAGWEADPSRFLLSVPCVVATDRGEALAIAEKAWSYFKERLTGSFEERKRELSNSYYSETAHLQVQKAETVLERCQYGGMIVGTPGEVVAQIRALVASLGIGTLGLQMQFGNISVTHTRQSIQLFRHHVRDHFV